MKGYNANDIAAELEIQRRDALKLIRDWQSLLQAQAESGVDIRDRVSIVLEETDQHWREIQRRAWETVEQADQQGQLGSKNQALKLLADINKNRIKTFQDAGINEDTELIEEMNETQRRQEILIKLLREIKEKHPEVASLIAKRLSEIEAEVEVVSIEGE